MNKRTNEWAIERTTSKQNREWTALIRFADRYFIWAALVYSLKCRMPTNTRNFIFAVAHDSRLVLLLLLCFRLHFSFHFIWFFLESKKIPLKFASFWRTHTQTDRKCVWSDLVQWRLFTPLTVSLTFCCGFFSPSLSMSLSRFLPFCFFVSFFFENSTKSIVWLFQSKLIHFEQQRHKLTFIWVWEIIEKSIIPCVPQSSSSKSMHTITITINSTQD